MELIGSTLRIDASGTHYRELNAQLREAVGQGVGRIEIANVFGQRYIGTDLHRQVEIEIEGTPGNDLGAFMDGPRVVVRGNAQDGCGNTMNEGALVIHGRAGDLTGYAMRGGKIFIRDSVGYRAAIHMKEYKGKRPVIVIGGTAQHFLGEYMAGGVLLVLGLSLPPGSGHTADFIGTGMHGGVIYIRGDFADYQLGKEVGRVEMEDEDRALLQSLVGEFASHFGYDPERIFDRPFTKLAPLSLRPYGRLYAH